MKNYYKLLLIVFIILFLLNNVKSQKISPYITGNIYACTTNDEIVIINPTNCTSSLLCNSSPFNDIAYEGGVLYGIGYGIDYGIFSIDTISGTETMIDSTGNGSLNSLVGDGNGHLFTADNNLWEYDIASGYFSLLGSVGYWSYGDLAFKNNNLYLLGRNTDSTVLIKISLNPFSYSVVGTLNFGTNHAYGLATISIDGKESLYASVTDTSMRNDLYLIDETNATAICKCSNGMGIISGINGLASKTEHNNGINEIIRNNDIYIYPNPSASFLIFQKKSHNTESYILTIRTFQGQQILQENVKLSNLYKLDLSNINDGIYFLTLQGDKEEIVRKIVVQNK